MSEKIKTQLELTDEFLIQRYNEIYKDNMIWFILGSLVSAENFWDVNENTTADKYDELIDTYVEHIYKLSEIATLIHKCNEIPESDQNKIMSHAIQGVRLLTREMLGVREKWAELKK